MQAVLSARRFFHVKRKIAICSACVHNQTKVCTDLTTANHDTFQHELHPRGGLIVRLAIYLLGLLAAPICTRETSELFFLLQKRREICAPLQSQIESAFDSRSELTAGDKRWQFDSYANGLGANAFLVLRFHLSAMH